MLNGYEHESTSTYIYNTVLSYLITISIRNFRELSRSLFFFVLTARHPFDFLFRCITNHLAPNHLFVVIVVGKIKELLSPLQIII